MHMETAAGSQDAALTPSSPKSRRGRRWLIALLFLTGASVFLWRVADHAMRASTITLLHDTRIKVLGGFTGTPAISKDSRPKMTISYDVTVQDEGFEQRCKNYWNQLHPRLPSWVSSKLKAFPPAKPEKHASIKPQVIALAASQPMDFAEWSITVRDGRGRDVPVFSATPQTKKSSPAPLPLRLLQGEYPSDSEQLTLRFEFRGVKRTGPGGRPLEYPVTEVSVANPFHGHHAITSTRASSKGLVGSQRITAEHFRLDTPRTELLQEVTFRLRCDPFRDVDDGFKVWDTTICNPAGGWDRIPHVKVKRIPAEQVQEIVCRTSGWPTNSPLRVRFWLSPRFGPSRPPTTSFEFKQVMIPTPGLGKPHELTSRSGNMLTKLVSVQNRSEGMVTFKVTDWPFMLNHEFTSWYLRDSRGNTTHLESGDEYQAWAIDDGDISPKRVSFGTNLPTNAEWFDVGLTQVVPEMVELEFPPKPSR